MAPSVTLGAVGNTWHKFVLAGCNTSARDSAVVDARLCCQTTHKIDWKMGKNGGKQVNTLTFPLNFPPPF